MSIIVDLVLNSPNLAKENILGDFVVGIDAGTDFLLKNNLPCHLAIGDFDSIITNINDLNCEKISYNVDKDFSDSYGAILEIKKRGYKEVRIHGLTGGRIDHVLCNVYLLLFAQKLNIKSHAIVGNSFIFPYKKGKLTFKVKKDDVVSFFSTYKTVFGESKNLKYQTNGKEVYKYNSSLSLSNEAIDNGEVVVDVKRGEGIIIITTK